MRPLVFVLFTAIVVACGSPREAPVSAATPLAAPAPPREPPVAPAPAPPPAPPPLPSLASRLGGAPGLARLVHDTAERVLARGRRHDVLPAAERERVERGITAWLCGTTGGTECPGEALDPAAMGARVTERDFDAFLADLSTTMAAHGIGEVEQNELLAVVGPQRAQVVSGHGR